VVVRRSLLTLVDILLAASFLNSALFLVIIRVDYDRDRSRGDLANRFPRYGPPRCPYLSSGDSYCSRSRSTLSSLGYIPSVTDSEDSFQHGDGQSDDIDLEISRHGHQGRGCGLWEESSGFGSRQSSRDSLVNRFTHCFHPRRQ
jgi:hypothetical protein